jgi:hypothetical protein
MASSCDSVGPETSCEELLREGLLDAEGLAPEAEALADGLAEGIEEASVSPDALGLLPVEILGESFGSA